jgi:hypothetical protein
MPDKRLGDIDKRRQDSIEHIITSMHDLLDQMRKKPQMCSFECDSILLGALTKGLDAQKLFSPRLMPPFPELSFESITKSLSAIRSPKWYAQSRTNVTHRCTLNSRIDPIIDSLKQQRGLNLEDYC